MNTNGQQQLQKVSEINDNLFSFQDDWAALEMQIRSGLNVNRGPILHTAIQQRRFRIAEKLIDNG